MTDISLRLTDDAVDEEGVARLAPIEAGPVEERSDIAPWLSTSVSTALYLVRSAWCS